MCNNSTLIQSGYCCHKPSRLAEVTDRHFVTTVSCGVSLLCVYIVTAWVYM